jgi:hypothetical protein
LFGQDSEVGIAWRQIGPCVADANDWATVKHLVRVALVFDPTAVDEAELIRASEPFTAAELAM